MQDTYRSLEGIGKGRIDRIVVGKMRMNTDLLGGITELIKREGIRTGVIISAVGALKKATFRNVKIMPPDFKVERHHRLYLELEQPLEIVSMTGWIATKADGETEIHAHFSASTVMDGKVVTLGGHLTPGTLTSIKVVVVIAVIEDTDIRAAMDSNINQVDVKIA
jgi:predicted DNA-binding protein with PD1-like motif